MTLHESKPVFTAFLHSHQGITFTILALCALRPQKSHLIEQQVDAQIKPLQPYLKLLVDKDLLIDASNGNTYRTTEKGKHFMIWILLKWIANTRENLESR